MPKYLYRYNGKEPWQRRFGKPVLPGTTFVPSGRELRAFRKYPDKYGELFTPSGEEPSFKEKKLVEAKQQQLQREAEKRAQQDEGWTLRVSPEDYLARYPEGKHADLARRLLVTE